MTSSIMCCVTRRFYTFLFFGVCSLVCVPSAFATRYFYDVHPGDFLAGVVYENDRAFGGSGRSRFLVDFFAQDISLVADDQTGTVVLDGTVTARLRPSGTDFSQLGNIPALVPGTYRFQAAYANAVVRDPEAPGGDIPILVQGGAGGRGDGFFQRIDGGQPFYVSGDGTQRFWGMDFNGVPPAGHIQLPSFMAAAQGNLHEGFLFEGWFNAGSNFYHGDIFTRLLFAGNDRPALPPQIPPQMPPVNPPVDPIDPGIPTEPVPEPMSALLLGSAMLGLTYKKNKMGAKA